MDADGLLHKRNWLAIPVPGLILFTLILFSYQNQLDYSLQSLMMAQGGMLEIETGILFKDITFRQSQALYSIWMEQ